MLKLKPSARTSKRYLLLEGRKENVEKAVLDYVGILGFAKANPIFVKKVAGKGKLVLAINRSELDKIRASFAISADIITVLKVSGTLKGLSKT